MNTVRLVFGWLFLAGFTAAGTYYAMDELDQRVGLARFQLHEKLGVTRYAASVRPPVNNQTPPINNQPSPINNQTPPINNQTPPINNQTPPINNQTPPINNQTPPINNQTPPINNQTPPINNQTPPINNQTPPINNQPPPINNQTPPINNQPPPINNQTPPINNQPPVNPPRSRPADFTDTNIRLVQLKGQATRFKSTISRMQAQYGTARLDEPMSNLNRLLRQAEIAMNAADTAAARRYMDQADNEVAKLKELLDQ